MSLKRPSTSFEQTQYCRLCRITAKKLLKKVTKEARENFYSITNVRMVKSDVISNLICVICDEKLRDTRKFRDGLIENEEKLLLFVPQSSTHFTFVDPLNPMNEEAKSPNVHDSTEILEEDDGDDMEETIFKVLKEEFYEEMATIEISSEDELKLAEPKKHEVALKIYFCDFCGSQFFSHHLLQNHMIEHMQEKPFKCRMVGCDASFWTREKLSKHNIYTHSDDCICDTCGVKFKCKGTLKTHIKIKHQGFRYKCKIEGCPWESQTSGAIARHISTVHNKEFEICESCGKTINSVYMKRHQRMFHAELKYKCAFCEKKFTQMFLKNAHEKNHGEANVICTYCGDKFTEVKNMKRHVYSRHQKTKFNCRVPGCSSVLSSKDNYRCHIRTVHRNLPRAEIEEVLQLVRKQKPDHIVDPDMIQ